MRLKVLVRSHKKQYEAAAACEGSITAPEKIARAFVNRVTMVYPKNLKQGFWNGRNDKYFVVIKERFGALERIGVWVVVVLSKCIRLLHTEWA